MNWAQFWDPVAVGFEHWTYNDVFGTHITSDEVYRFLLMVFIFFLAIPLTRSNYLNKRSYSTAVGLHLLAGVWFAVDLIRFVCFVSSVG